VTEADDLRHRALYLEISNAIARILDDTTMMHFLRTTCCRGACIEVANQTDDPLQNVKRILRKAGIELEQRQPATTACPNSWRSSRPPGQTSALAFRVLQQRDDVRMLVVTRQIEGRDAWLRAHRRIDAAR
jgi:hypothetical protein